MHMFVPFIKLCVLMEDYFNDIVQKFQLRDNPKNCKFRNVYDIAHDVLNELHKLYGCRKDCFIYNNTVRSERDTNWNDVQSTIHQIEQLLSLISRKMTDLAVKYKNKLDESVLNCEKNYNERYDASYPFLNEVLQNMCNIIELHLDQYVDMFKNTFTAFTKVAVSRCTYNELLNFRLKTTDSNEIQNKL